MNTYEKITKLFVLIAAMAVAFSLVACSSNKPTDSTVTEVESIEINDIELNTTDKDVVIEYTLMPEGAEGEVTMSIADDTIAAIKDGKITAVSEGETELLVSVGEIAEVARVRRNLCGCTLSILSFAPSSRSLISTPLI